LRCQRLKKTLRKRRVVVISMFPAGRGVEGGEEEIQLFVRHTPDYRRPNNLFFG
jgi:hypothetical protein